MEQDEGLDLSELRRRYDELVVNYPEGIEKFKQDKLSPRDFATVMKWCSVNFADSAAKAKLAVGVSGTISKDINDPALADDIIIGRPRIYLEDVQRQHNFDWDDMEGVVIHYEEGQL